MFQDEEIVKNELIREEKLFAWFKMYKKQAWFLWNFAATIIMMTVKLTTQDGEIFKNESIPNIQFTTCKTFPRNLFQFIPRKFSSLETLPQKIIQMMTQNSLEYNVK